MSYSDIKRRMSEIESRSYPELKTTRVIKEFTRGVKVIISDPVAIGHITGTILVASVVIFGLKKVPV